MVMMVVCLSFYQDPRDYFDSQQANALGSFGASNDGRNVHNCVLSADDVFHHLRNQISYIKINNLNCPGLQPEMSLKVNSLMIMLIISVSLLQAN
jgi:hypothetical protein